MKRIMLRRIDMAKTKIVVIQLKEIIYTVIFAALGILLILLLIFMFRGGKDDGVAKNGTELYKSGKYTSTISLNDTDFNLEVVVDNNHINHVDIQNINDSIAAMFPLVKPSLEDISLQLSNDVPLDKIEIDQEKQYTEQMLIDAIKAALEPAKLNSKK